MATNSWSRGSSEVSMFDVWHHMDYIRSHYNATAEILLDAGEDDEVVPMLYLTVIASSTYPDNERYAYGQCWRVTDDLLHRMPQVLLDALFEAHEQIDGWVHARARRDNYS